MTHDELLADIDNKILLMEHTIYPIYMQAFRAVVELHKPIQCRINMDNYDYLGCSSCTEWTHEGDSNVAYPCQTIQVIEKELK